MARILRLLERYGLRGTFYVPGWTVAHHAPAIRPIRDADHELAAYGNVHESLDTLSDDEEARVLEEQLDIWKSCLDLRPAGYRSPSWELNAGTPALLKSRGFMYDSSLMGDDIPWISGRAGRLLGLERLIQHMRRVPGVWFATVAEIAAWAARQEVRIVDPRGGTTRP